MYLEFLKRKKKRYDTSEYKKTMLYLAEAQEKCIKFQKKPVIKIQISDASIYC